MSQPTPDCGGCEYADTCYCEDQGGVATVGHRECYIWVRDDAEYGDLDALGCDVGCKPCLDYPDELQYHAAAKSPSRNLSPERTRRSKMPSLL